MYSAYFLSCNNSRQKFLSLHKIFTVDLQVAAVLLCPARQDEIVTGLDLEVISLILVLEGEKKQSWKLTSA